MSLSLVHSYSRLILVEMLSPSFPLYSGVVNAKWCELAITIVFVPLSNFLTNFNQLDLNDFPIRKAGHVSHGVTLRDQSLI